MKRFLVILLISVSFKTYSQSKFDYFIRDLSTFNYPLDYNFINAKKITINRKQCWKYWILPVTKINLDKPDSLISFEFDTAVINMYHQWDKKDWNKKEPIYLYSPIMTGELYCVGKSFINSKTIGIIWYFYQKDVIYGQGAHYWFATYDLLGNMIDYIKIYENTSGSMVFESYKFERKFKYYNKTRIGFSDRTISYTTNLDSLDNKIKIDTILIKQSFLLDSIGKFIKDK
jgi:hypothetical protein